MLVSAAASGLPGDRRFTTAHSLVGLFLFYSVFLSRSSGRSFRVVGRALMPCVPLGCLHASDFLILWMLLASYFGLTGGNCPAGIASYIGNGRVLDAGHLVLAENNRLDLSGRYTWH